MKAPIHKEKIEQRLVATFVVIALILVSISVFSLRNITRSMEGSDWVNHTHALILEADAIQTSLLTGKAALQDYLLTAQERSLGDARVAYSEAAEHLEIAKALSRSDEGRTQQLAKIDPLVTKLVEFAREAVAVRQQGNETAIRTLISTQSSDTSLEEIKRVILQLKGDAQALLHERDKRAYLLAQATRWTVSAGVVVNLLLLVFVGWLVRDDLQARRKAARALASANEQLEAGIAERTHALVEANKSLEKENLERQWQHQSMEHQLRYNQLIINSIDDLVFVTTKMLKITRLTPAVTHHLGFETSEMVGQPLQRYLQGGTGETGLEGLTSALKEGRELHNYPGVLLGKDARQLNVRLRLFPLRDRDRVVGGVVTVKLNVAGEP